jgi:hypothetical protein
MYTDMMVRSPYPSVNVDPSMYSSIGRRKPLTQADAARNSKPSPPGYNDKPPLLGTTPDPAWDWGYSIPSLQAGIAPMLPKSFGPANLSLGRALGLAGALGEEENKRQQEAFNLIRNQLAKSNRMDAGLTQEEIDLRLGQASDAASERMLQGGRAARGMMGTMGMTGGGRAGALEGQLRLGRMGQIQGARGALAVEEAARRGEAANRMFQRAGQAAEFINQGPSMLLLDQLNSTIDTALNAFIGQKQADAADKASRRSMWASILGGGIGAIFGRK